MYDGFSFGTNYNVVKAHFGMGRPSIFLPQNYLAVLCQAGWNAQLKEDGKPNNSRDLRDPQPLN